MCKELIISEAEIRDIAFGNKHFVIAADKDMEVGDTLLLRSEGISHITRKITHIENLTVKRDWCGQIQILGW